jgi:hypothetical protein
MSEQRDSRWYRREARHTRYKAEATSDPVLRDSYLQVAEAYEQLADAIEQPARVPPRIGPLAAQTPRIDAGRGQAKARAALNLYG